MADFMNKMYGFDPNYRPLWVERPRGDLSGRVAETTNHRAERAVRPRARRRL